jgi:hypothetical protein
MTCDAVCPEAAITCRLAAEPHAEHFGGYGDEARSWPNLSYTEPPASAAEHLSGAAKVKADLTAMARRLREAQ